MYVLYLALAVAFNVGNNLMLKVAGNSTLPWSQRGQFFVLALGLGLFNSLCYARSLDELKLSTIYPVFSGSSILVVILASALIFGEILTWRTLGGAALIVAGIALARPL